MGWTRACFHRRAEGELGLAIGKKHETRSYSGQPTVGTVLVTGIIFGAATIWHTRSLSASYDDALRAELEQKAYSSAFTVKAFLDELGPSALETVEAVMEAGGTQGAPTASAGVTEIYTMNLRGGLPERTVQTDCGPTPPIELRRDFAWLGGTSCG